MEVESQDTNGSNRPDFSISTEQIRSSSPNGQLIMRLDFKGSLFLFSLINSRSPKLVVRPRLLSLGPEDRKLGVSSKESPIELAPFRCQLSKRRNGMVRGVSVLVTPFSETPLRGMLILKSVWSYHMSESLGLSGCDSRDRAPCTAADRSQQLNTLSTCPIR